MLKLFSKPNGSLRVAKKDQLRFKHGGSIRWLEADWQADVKAIIWGKRINAKKEQVRIHLY